MIGYVRGTVSHMVADHCFIDVQGVGYRIFIASPTRQKLSVGKIATLFTHMHVREDAMLLYGFYTQDEYDLFLTLMSINGIGPRVAMGILSAIDPNQFRIAISTKNIGILTKLPGVGKKTAERMILELKDKIGILVDEDTIETGVAVVSGDIVDEAIQALLALGYNQNEIIPIVKKVSKNAQSVEALIKLALREFSRG
ncbi:MAG: Holliday junction branch migration protein RuvA [Sporomusaceae bacterium]|nr:Holliday junction branch migration protein RuvA [Sporomusaceae bacterium]